jgi:hypothetical protein
VTQPARARGYARVLLWSSRGLIARCRRPWRPARRSSFSVHATRRFFLSLTAVAFLSLACQRESATQSFEHGGSRSTAVASADTAVSNQSNFNDTAIASGRMLARQLMLAWLRATRHESGQRCAARRRARLLATRCECVTRPKPDSPRTRSASSEPTRGSTQPRATGLPGPESAEALPVPANHGPGRTRWSASRHPAH